MRKTHAEDTVAAPGELYAGTTGTGLAEALGVHQVSVVEMAVLVQLLGHEPRRVLGPDETTLRKRGLVEVHKAKGLSHTRLTARGRAIAQELRRVATNDKAAAEMIGIFPRVRDLA